MRRNCVLIVDDDPIAVEVARERLEGAGYRVCTYDRGLGLSKVILDHEPEAVLLDVMLPDLWGRQLIELVTRHPRFQSVCVILHSSKGGSELLELIQQTGASGAIVKTHHDQRFLDRFEHLLGRMRDRGARFSRRAQ